MTFNKSEDDETLDFNFAMELLELKIREKEVWLSQQEEVFDGAARLEKKRCQQLIAKLKEAMIKLLTLLGKCLEAVQLALESGKINEA